ncbi:hypothetical protein SBA_ch1_28650 [Sphingomonas bisphenolicum]|uniref:Uncharacterized protein n=1 Tax=Sphingomonas bisphenolicum TaxID=296544 RepID=A0ABM7G494_9SPHN|nr:hypothetical protein SBA_ch1_28650 [Sphingomonas bisphenolicum]
MLTAEITIYCKDGDAVWRQIKVVPDVMSGLDYLCAIRSTVMSVYETKGGHMIDQHLHDPDRAFANDSA